MNTIVVIIKGKTMELNALLMHFNADLPDIVEITDFDDHDEQFTVILDRQGAVRLLEEIVSAMTSDESDLQGKDFSESFYYLMNHMHTRYGQESIGSFLAGLEHIIVLMQESRDDETEIDISDCTIIINENGAQAIDIEEN